MKNQYGIVYKITIRSTGVNQKINIENINEVKNTIDADSELINLVISKLPIKYSKKLISAKSAIYNYINKVGIKINGEVIIPIKKYIEFETELNKKINEFNNVVNEIIKAYRNNEFDLNFGNLKNFVDYIDEEKLRNFRVEVRKFVDFNSPYISSVLNELEESVVQKLKEECKRDYDAERAETLTNISNFVVIRIKNLLQKLIEKVGEKGTKIKYLLDDIKEIINEMPSYNILNDPKITEQINEINKIFGNLEKEDFEDKKECEKIKENAKSLLQKFGYT